MRYLKIFEEYNDEVGKTARNWFDLTHKITLRNGYELTGPLENKDEAEAAAKKINNKLYSLRDDVYGSHDKVMDEWKHYLEELGYTYPEYKVGVIEYDSDENVIKLYVGKEYQEIEGIEKEINYSAMIGNLLRKMEATHVYRGEDGILIPIDRFPTSLFYYI